MCHLNEVLFTDMEYAKAHSPMKGRVAHGALSYTFAEGLCIVDTMQQTGVAFLHMEMDMKAPAFVGDTIYVEIEVIEARLTRSDTTRGLVRTRNTVVKQDGTVVVRGQSETAVASVKTICDRTRMPVPRVYPAHRA